MPLALQTSTHWVWPVELTTACTAVGATTQSNMANKASTAVKRR